MMRSFIGNQSNCIKDTVKDQSKIDVIWVVILSMSLLEKI